MNKWGGIKYQKKWAWVRLLRLGWKSTIGISALDKWARQHWQGIVVTGGIPHKFRNTKIISISTCYMTVPSGIQLSSIPTMQTGRMVFSSTGQENISFTTRR
jgi:hypothetical protein